MVVDTCTIITRVGRHASGRASEALAIYKHASKSGSATAQEKARFFEGVDSLFGDCAEESVLSVTRRQGHGGSFFEPQAVALPGILKKKALVSLRDVIQPVQSESEYSIASEDDTEPS